MPSLASTLMVHHFTPIECRCSPSSIGRLLEVFGVQVCATSGKKKPANDFSLRHMCYWHVLGAIGRPLAGHWQVGQQIGCQLLNTLPISWQWYKWHNWVDALLPKATICDIFMGCNIRMHSYL